MTREEQRLAEAREPKVHWKPRGSYPSERAWGTVREDYSEYGTAWDCLPHDHARSRAYRWNEDGIAAVSDRHQILCFSVALWNHRDPILKERLFGLTGSEGNHGEDVKELYYYLDSTPTHSYMRMLYKYPQAEFPYQKLLDDNRGRAGRARRAVHHVRGADLRHEHEPGSLARLGGVRGDRLHALDLLPRAARRHAARRCR
jgi:hypothetical protein